MTVKLRGIRRSVGKPNKPAGKQMPCPDCSATHSHVIETRQITNGIRRRRICNSCERRFSTREYVVYDLPELKNPNRLIRDNEVRI